MYSACRSSRRRNTTGSRPDEPVEELPEERPEEPAEERPEESAEERPEENEYWVLWSESLEQIPKP